MACGYGGGLNRMKEHGNVLLTGAEKEELGILVFDVTSAPAGFVAENPDLVAKLQSGHPLTAPDAATFYTPGAEGYTDY